MSDQNAQNYINALEDVLAQCTHPNQVAEQQADGRVIARCSNCGESWG